tara:strand:+ start:28858 stop:29763 length:906 start_codon:yes stop_codon:yes gene_type:complete
MGAADLVPGVSGGTIALITGIYKELLNSINSFSIKTIKLLILGKFNEAWEQLNLNFILPLFAGIITSILVFSRILEWLMINEPIGLWSFFFGLLIACIFFLVKTKLRYSLNSMLYLVAGSFFSFIVTQLDTFSNEIPLWYIFLAGFIGISAMILPGLSGAYVLFIMGVYKRVLLNIRLAQELILDFNKEKFIEVASELGVFVFGILVGIKVFSKILSWLLDRYPDKCIAFLIGLMLGALIKVWPWQNQVPKLSGDDPSLNISVLPNDFLGGSPEIVKAFLLMFSGFILIYVIERSKILLKK